MAKKTWVETLRIAGTVGLSTLAGSRDALAVPDTAGAEHAYVVREQPDDPARAAQKRMNEVREKIEAEKRAKLIAELLETHKGYHKKIADLDEEGLKREIDAYIRQALNENVQIRWHEDRIVGITVNAGDKFVGQQPDADGFNWQGKALIISEMLPSMPEDAQRGVMQHIITKGIKNAKMGEWEISHSSAIRQLAEQMKIDKAVVDKDPNLSEYARLLTMMNEEVAALLFPDNAKKRKAYIDAIKDFAPQQRAISMLVGRAMSPPTHYFSEEKGWIEAENNDYVALKNAAKEKSQEELVKLAVETISASIPRYIQRTRSTYNPLSRGYLWVMPDESPHGDRITDPHTLARLMVQDFPQALAPFKEALEALKELKPGDAAFEKIRDKANAHIKDDVDPVTDKRPATDKEMKEAIAAMANHMLDVIKETQVTPPAMDIKEEKTEGRSR